ncbi:MAG TPA: SDR family oxidoreductase [Candidatus Dormibacteraeota bacterium]|nr:SDR family oxidoreductase [Candidatus Dormibacteraeota bacterium]
MILLAGGTGTLGRKTVRILSARGRKVRILTRNPERAGDLESDATEIVAGDVRDPASLQQAVSGIEAVISAISGYGPSSGADPRSVDGEGNHNLIRAAEAAGVGHFVLVSMHDAGPHHPMELARMKFAAEQELKRSRMDWTIIRPTAFMETWNEIIGAPLRKAGWAVIFGRGDNPVNFVSADDVANLVALAVDDPNMRRLAIDLGGPENLTLTQLVQVCEAESGRKARHVRIPRPILRLIAALARPLNAAAARLAADALVMDEMDFSFDVTLARRRLPSVPLTTFAEVVRRG